MKTLIRLHQLLLVLAILSGCYAPDVRDCTVSCEGSDECAEGQMCRMGRCVAEGATCMGDTPAVTPDAGPPESQVVLKIKIGGEGKVEIAGAGSCTQAECYLSIPKGTVTATAVPTSTMHPFEKWVTKNCEGEGLTCTFSVTSNSYLEVKFK